MRRLPTVLHCLFSSVCTPQAGFIHMSHVWFRVRLFNHSNYWLRVFLQLFPGKKNQYVLQQVNRINLQHARSEVVCHWIVYSQISTSIHTHQLPHTSGFPQRWTEADNITKQDNRQLQSSLETILHFNESPVSPASGKYSMWLHLSNNYTVTIKGTWL